MKEILIDKPNKICTIKENGKSVSVPFTKAHICEYGYRLYNVSETKRDIATVLIDNLDLVTVIETCGAVKYGKWLNGRVIRGAIAIDESEDC